MLLCSCVPRGGRTSPAMTAVVVAIAGMMRPAIFFTWRRSAGAIEYMRARRFCARTGAATCKHVSWDERSAYLSLTPALHTSSVQIKAHGGGGDEVHVAVRVIVLLELEHWELVRTCASATLYSYVRMHSSALTQFSTGICTIQNSSSRIHNQVCVKSNCTCALTQRPKALLPLHLSLVWSSSNSRSAAASRTLVGESEPSPDFGVASFSSVTTRWHHNKNKYWLRKIFLMNIQLRDSYCITIIL